MDFIGNFLLLPVVKKFENRLMFDEVVTMSLVAHFLGQCVVLTKKITECVKIFNFERDYF